MYCASPNYCEGSIGYFQVHRATCDSPTGQWTRIPWHCKTGTRGRRSNRGKELLLILLLNIDVVGLYALVHGVVVVPTARGVAISFHVAMSPFRVDDVDGATAGIVASASCVVVDDVDFIVADVTPLLMPPMLLLAHLVSMLLLLLWSLLLLLFYLLVVLSSASTVATPTVALAIVLRVVGVALLAHVAPFALLFCSRLHCSCRSLSLQICKAVSDLWPACKMITGSARHSKTHGGIERFNKTTQDEVERISYFQG